MSDHTDPTVDVVIVGGGFAGVVAARDLSNAGADVVLLEGRDRLGGRAWSKDSPLGKTLEMGGAYVHWTQPHLWAEVVAHDQEIVPGAWLDDAYWITDGAVRKGTMDDLFGGLAASMAQISEGAMEAYPSPHRPFPLSDAASAADAVSITDKIDELELTDDQAALARAWATLTFHGDPQAGSLSSILKLIALTTGNWPMYIEANSVFRLQNGTKALLDAIHAESKATTRLSTVVDTIRTVGDNVQVVTSTGEEINARHVVVTAPVGALRNITFEPGLSAAKAAAVAEGQVSKGVKVWMLAKGHVDHFIAWAPDSYPLTMMGYEYEQGDNTLLLGFGPDSSQLDITDVAAVQAAVHQWRPDIELLGVDGHDWTADPLSQETWLTLRTGQLSGSFEALRNREGRLWFAGADYADGWVGYIDGALESGRRVAHQVAQELR